MYESPSEVIHSCAKYLGEPLPDRNPELLEHLKGLEACRLKLAEAKVDWHKLLHEKESQMLHPKDAMFTEMDRKVMLNASVAVIRRDYDYLVTIEQLIAERLSFGRELWKALS